MNGEILHEIQNCIRAVILNSEFSLCGLVLNLYSDNHLNVIYSIRWSNLKKRVALGKQRIGPRIQAKGDVISKDLSRFGDVFATLKERFKTSPCLKYNYPKQEAMNLISEFNGELRGLQAQARDLIELQELLETSVFNFSLLKK